MDISDGSSEPTHLPVTSPSSGALIETIPVTPAAGIAEAAERARTAQPDWAATPLWRRSEILADAATRIDAQAEGLAQLLARESGKVIRQSRFEVTFTVQLLRGNAERLRALRGALIPTESLAQTATDFAWESRVPLGTIAAILPFNFPLELLVEKAGAALAMGNAVLAKLPETAPLSSLAMMQCFYEAGVPEAVFPSIVGGRDTGACLVEQPGLAAISLTGSTAAGIAVAKATAPTLRKLHLELGGNDAAVVLDDADLDLAVPQFIFGRTLMNGQACASNKRLIVHRSRLDELEEKLIDGLRDLVMGDASNEASTLGPLISESAAERVIAQIKQAVADGGEIAYGDGQRDTCFVMPHVLRNVPTSAAIASDDEIFGPVLPIIPVDSEEEALAVANQSSFGLSGCVFTRDWQRGLKVAERMECGGCVVNGTGNYRPIIVPFGGVKMSGLGREGLGYTLEEMSQTKYIVLKNFRG